MKRLICCGLAIAAVLLVSPTHADTVKQYSVKDFFKNSDFAAMRLSPNGEWLAAIGPCSP